MVRIGNGQHHQRGRGYVAKNVAWRHLLKLPRQYVAPGADPRKRRYVARHSANSDMGHDPEPSGNNVDEVRIFSWNPGSFTDPVKRTLAEGAITDTRSDVVCLQETWMATEPEIAGIRSVINRAGRPTRQGHLHRGQWMGARIPIGAANPPLTHHEGPEVLWGWAKQYGLLIGNVYLPVQQEWSETEFFTQLEDHRANAQVIILVGDFNCRQDAITAINSLTTENPRIRTCRELLERGFTLLETSATHRHRSYAEATTIDLVFIWSRPTSNGIDEEDDGNPDPPIATVSTLPILLDRDGNPSYGHYAIIVTLRVAKMAGDQQNRSDRLIAKGLCNKIAVAMQDKRRRKLAQSAAALPSGKRFFLTNQDVRRGALLLTLPIASAHVSQPRLP
jgi:hypothetical protein